MTPLATYCIFNNIPRTTFLFWLERFETEILVNFIMKTGRPTIITEKLINLIKLIIDNNPFTYIKDI